VKRCSAQRSAVAKCGDASVAEQVGERVHYCGPVFRCTCPGGSCACPGLSPGRDTADQRACSERTGNAAPGAVKHLQKKAHGSTAGLGYTTAQRERGGDDRHGVGVRHSGGSTNRARLKGRRRDVGARSHGWRRKASDRLTEGRMCRRKQ
jgi:hypothetical protein